MDEISNLTTCLYVNNLNEKIKVDVVKKMLNMLFSQYGRVKSVTAYSGYKTKGQAWVQFETEEAATAALAAKQGFNFYDKPLRLQYAKTCTDENAERKK
jgi:U1 small nuclear ribonucleoprotein A